MYIIAPVFSDDKLYIVMELIEGAPLGDRCKSLLEKKSYFKEERVWNIFIQLVLALRYLHKEKHIVHRDLTPNNIMLSKCYRACACVHVGVGAQLAYMFLFRTHALSRTRTCCMIRTYALQARTIT